jgi:hypothetical protein
MAADLSFTVPHAWTVEITIRLVQLSQGDTHESPQFDHLEDDVEVF